jgi:hypothetical protein
MAQLCSLMTDGPDTVGTPKTGTALRLLMVTIALVSLVPAIFAMVILILGIVVGSFGSGAAYLDVQSWVIVVVMLVLCIGTFVTVAVAAMSGDRRSAWIGLGLFVVTILPLIAIRFERTPNVAPKAPQPLMIRTAQ